MKVSALLRLLVLIPLGYVAACLAAGTIIMLSLYDFGRDAEFAMEGFAIAFALFMGAYAGAFAAMPMLIAVLLAEFFRWRSFFFWAPFGGVLGAASILVPGEALPGSAPEGIVTGAAAGLAGGAVYWAIAGRRSVLGAETAKPALRSLSRG